MRVAPRGLLTEEESPAIRLFGPSDSVRRPGFSRRLANAIVQQALAGVYDLPALMAAAPNANHQLFLDVPCDYGPRIGDQLDKAIAILQGDRDSRRAVIVLARPDDAVPPCILSIQFLVRPADTLRTIVTMRSWDSGLGLPYDVSLFQALAWKASQALAISPGLITVFTASLHAYLKDSP